MSNVINTVTANRTLASPDPSSSFSYDTAGRTKPLKDKAVILPSRIFGSPIEYAKDTVKDVINIGRAAKGQANDHELGRINSLAMKLGSLGIASYLCVKNPFKLSKAMEFAGFGTFFASMALWPKLAIQLPLKLRTGVDFMQQYVDSQGRKKMLYQDPQYVMTDLLPRRDLNIIGKKMGVSAELPDRDNFIKRRAHKTALQANTLWMLTAGFAAPVMSALACCTGEKFLKPFLLKRELKQTEIGFLSSSYVSEAQKKKLAAEQAVFNRYLRSHGEQPITEIIPELSARFDNILQDTSSFQLKDTLRESLEDLSYRQIDEEAVKSAFGAEAVENLKNQGRGEALSLYIEKYRNEPEEAVKRISNLMSDSAKEGSLTPEDAASKLRSVLKSKKVKEAYEPLEGLFGAFNEFKRSKTLLDKYVSARIGERPDSYIASQWDKVTKRFLKALDISGWLTTGRLKDAAAGDGASAALIQKQLERLVSMDNEYNKTITDLLKMINDYEDCLETDMLGNIRALSAEELIKHRSANRTHVIFNDLRDALADNSFFKLAEKTAGTGRAWSSPSAPGTLHRNFTASVQERSEGAKACFYRIIQALDIFRQSKLDRTGECVLYNRLRTYLAESNIIEPDKKVLERLVQCCKDIVLKAAVTDHIEKFTSRGDWDLTQAEYKAVMKALYADNESGHLRTLLEQQTFMSDTDAAIAFKRFGDYKKETLAEVVNFRNHMRPDLEKRAAGVLGASANGIKRNNLAGKNLIDLTADAAKSAYNSKKWLMLFGGTMAVLTAATVAAGFMLGRKDKMEKQAEEESRKNKNV